MIQQKWLLCFDINYNGFRKNPGSLYGPKIRLGDITIRASSKWLNVHRVRRPNSSVSIFTEPDETTFVRISILLLNSTMRS